MRRKKAEDEERALAGAEADLANAGPRLREALSSRRGLTVARAAKIIQKHRLDGFENELKAALARLVDGGDKTDPSCHGKLAILEALDYGESCDEKPFLRAIRIVQLEPVWGGKADTATGVRARGIVALARLGHDEFDLHAARLLVDKEPPVRQAALDALGHRGARSGAALALLKLRIGDEDPMVTLAAMNALLQLAPERALEELRPLLDGADRELAAVALGQSRLDGALDLLTAALRDCLRSDERRPLYRGIGLFRDERALAILEEIIREERIEDAKAAIESLAPRRYDPGVKDRVRRAAEKRHELRALVDSDFS